MFNNRIAPLTPSVPRVDYDRRVFVREAMENAYAVRCLDYRWATLYTEPGTRARAEAEAELLASEAAYDRALAAFHAEFSA